MAAIRVYLTLRMFIRPIVFYFYFVCLLFYMFIFVFIYYCVCLLNNSCESSIFSNLTLQCKNTELTVHDTADEII